MKTVIAVRHAKSSWAEAGKADIDRPLNERGRRDAPEMAGRLLKQKLIPDLLVSSSAKRARKTAQLFAETFNLPAEKLVLEPRLYLAEADTIYQVIGKQAPEVDILAFFAHNPGITEFVNTLTNNRIDDMPTCALFVVSARCNSWTEFEAAEKTFVFFDYPKSV